MVMNRKKPKILGKVKPGKYCIYGIFHQKTSKLVYVSMEVDQVELEFDLSDYDGEEYKLVSFTVLLV